ncbi:MAG: thioredoxin [Clostridiaceae bacterium]|jgi:thioredoxin 1|nr:thioredoxin [Oscillospiraceae bacterium]NLO62118.1 thioredoxin [Clostridiaceae bacterium]
MGKNTLELNEANFTETIASGLTLVDMYANWCMPCRMLAPTISTLADEYDGKVKVGKVNIDESPSIASQYGVMSIPTVILFKDGKPVGQKVGMADKKAYEQMIQSAN